MIRKIKLFEEFISESITKGDRVEFTEKVDGIDTKRIGKINEIAGKYALIEYNIDGKIAKTDVLISRLKKIQESTIFEKNKEVDKDIKNYMFFQNLASIKKLIDKILSKDRKKVDALLDDGNNWAVDHVSTSKDDIEEVSSFIANTDDNDDDISPEMKLAISEYHQAIRHQQKLQKTFIRTPKEKFNEKETLKNDLISCMRDVKVKEDRFRYLLKESGEEDLYEL